MCEPLFEDLVLSDSVCRPWLWLNSSCGDLEHGLELKCGEVCAYCFTAIRHVRVVVVVVAIVVAVAVVVARQVENAVVERDPEVCSSSGFVTFSSVLWQRLALKEDFRADKSEFIVSMPPDIASSFAPSPLVLHIASPGSIGMRGGTFWCLKC